MTLRLVREPSRDGATFGTLYLGDNPDPFCSTLEDEIREVAHQPVSNWKVAGATAIPAGRYQVVITPSQRFKRLLPLLLNVPGFSGVRIHPGNAITDTEGCILVGRQRKDRTIAESRLAFEPLFERLKRAVLLGDVWIDIESPAAPLPGVLQA